MRERRIIHIEWGKIRFLAFEVLVQMIDWAGNMRRVPGLLRDRAVLAVSQELDSVRAMYRISCPAIVRLQVVLIWLRLECSQANVEDLFGHGLLLHIDRETQTNQAAAWSRCQAAAWGANQSTSIMRPVWPERTVRSPAVSQPRSPQTVQRPQRQLPPGRGRSHWLLRRNRS